MRALKYMLVTKTHTPTSELRMNMLPFTHTLHDKYTLTYAHLCSPISTRLLLRKTHTRKYQSTSMAFDVIDANAVHTCTGQPLNSEIESITSWMLNLSFREAYQSLYAHSLTRTLNFANGTQSPPQIQTRTHGLATAIFIPFLPI